MTVRFPVGEALNETFQFALHRWSAILRFGWAPLAIAIAISLGLVFSILDIAALEAVEDPNALLNFGQFVRVPAPVAVFLAIGGVLLISLIMAGFMASIFRLVALGEDDGRFFNLRLDGPAFRVFFAQLILNVINYAIYAAGLIVASALTGISIGSAFGVISEFFRIVSEAAASGTDPDPSEVGEKLAPIGLFFVGGLFALLPMIFVNIRLSPFAAGSAAENRLLLLGAFRLTHGNFWPLLGYYVLLFVALMVIGVVFQIVISIIDVLSALPAGGAFSLISVIAAFIGIAASVAYQLFVLGLQLGGQGIVYRRLKTGA
jgi:hypothetical protein